MALKSGQKLAAVCLPEPRGPVIRGGEHASSVRAKNSACNLATVALECGQEFAGVGLPKARRLVAGGGEHALSVRAKDRAS